MDLSVDNLFFAILGIFIGAWLDNFFQTKRIIKEQKAQVLKDLMASRFDSPLDQKAAEAINFIPVLFSNNSAVLIAYEDFHDASVNGSKDIVYKFNSLISAIADDIGIHFKPLDLMRSPIKSKKRALEDYEFNERFNKFMELNDAQRKIRDL